jgi:hypothetical protein
MKFVIENYELTPGTIDWSSLSFARKMTIRREERKTLNERAEARGSPLLVRVILSRIFEQKGDCLQSTGTRFCHINAWQRVTCGGGEGEKRVNFLQGTAFLRVLFSLFLHLYVLIY